MIFRYTLNIDFQQIINSLWINKYVLLFLFIEFNFEFISILSLIFLPVNYKCIFYLFSTFLYNILIKNKLYRIIFSNLKQNSFLKFTLKIKKSINFFKIVVTLDKYFFKYILKIKKIKGNI